MSSFDSSMRKAFPVLKRLLKNGDVSEEAIREAIKKENFNDRQEAIWESILFDNIKKDPEPGPTTDDSHCEHNLSSVSSHELQSANATHNPAETERWLD